MRLRNVRIVLWKELVDALRDSRTVFLMVALPLVMYPALFAAMGYVERIMARKQEETHVSVAMVNPDAAPGLAKFLSEQERVNVSFVPEGGEERAGQMIRDGAVRVALLVPDAFEDSLRGEDTGRLTILYDGTDMMSATGRERITSHIVDYEREVVGERLKRRGLDISILETIAVSSRNVATKGEMGAFAMSFMIPFFLLILMCAGAQHIAIDVTAGEKERSTLETLLATSASRTEVVIGKFMAVCFSSLASTMAGLAGLLLTMYSGISILNAVAEGQLTISPNSVLVLLLAMIPAMIVVSACFVAIGCFAKSTKEGQTYSSYFYMIIMLGAAVTIFPGFDIGLKGYAIPVLGILFLARELLTSGFNALHVATALLSTIVAAALAIFVSIRLFSNEKVMFRI
ncbi:MAG: ABC transporter permease [Candidatus Eisenbacteria bacterium]